MRVLAPLALVALVALVALGCGAREEGPPASAAGACTLSRAEVVVGDVRTLGGRGPLDVRSATDGRIAVTWHGVDDDDDPYGWSAGSAEVAVLAPDATLERRVSLRQDGIHAWRLTGGDRPWSRRETLISGLRLLEEPIWAGDGVLLSGVAIVASEPEDRETDAEGDLPPAASVVVQHLPLEGDPPQPLEVPLERCEACLVDHQVQLFEGRVVVLHQQSVLPPRGKDPEPEVSAGPVRWASLGLDGGALEEGEVAFSSRVGALRAEAGALLHDDGKSVRSVGPDLAVRAGPVPRSPTPWSLGPTPEIGRWDPGRGERCLARLEPGQGGAAAQLAVECLDDAGQPVLGPATLGRGRVPTDLARWDDLTAVVSEPAEPAGPAMGWLSVVGPAGAQLGEDLPLGPVRRLTSFEPARSYRLVSGAAGLVVLTLTDTTIERRLLSCSR